MCVYAFCVVFGVITITLRIGKNIQNKYICGTNATGYYCQIIKATVYINCIELHYSISN